MFVKTCLVFGEDLPSETLLELGVLYEDLDVGCGLGA